MDALHSGVARYQAWLKQNPQSGRHIEEALQLISLLLPSPSSGGGGGGGGDTDGDGGVLAELGAGLASVVSLVNDVLLRPEAFAPTGAASASASAIRACLSVAASTDLLIEIIARRVGGNSARWNTIVVLEALRTVGRLLLLAERPDTFLVCGGQLVATPPPTLHTAPPPPTEWWRGSLTGLSIPCEVGELHPFSATGGPTAPAATAAANVSRLVALLRRGMREPQCAPVVETAAASIGTTRASEYPSLPPGCDAPGSSCTLDAAPLHAWGEVLHILQPLAFAALRRWRGARSWMPIVTSALLDAASARCTHVAGLRRVGERARFLPTQVASLSGMRDALADIAACLRTPTGPSHSPATCASGTFPPPPAAASEAAMLRALDGGGRGSSGGALLGSILRLGLLLFSPPPGVSAVDAAEIARRRALWAYYLLRSPLFYVVLRPASGRAVELTSRVPLLSVVVAYAADVVRFAGAHHYYAPH